MTKILCFSDLHSNLLALEKLIALLQEESFDACIICGDLTQFGDATEARQIIAQLAKAQQVKYFLIHGNCDPDATRQVMRETTWYMHGRSRAWNNYRLIGFGDVPLTPFNTHNEYAEAQLGLNLTRLTNNANNRLSHPNHNLIFISHSPAFGLNDMPRPDCHIGSKAILDFIHQICPWLMLHGHVHQDGGIAVYDYEKEKIEKHHSFATDSGTSEFPIKPNQGIIINVAAAKSGQAVKLEIVGNNLSITRLLTG